MKEVMEICDRLGMRFQPVNQDIAKIFCRKCGWPHTHRETNIEQFRKEPYGCPFCGDRNG